jgi:single-stranded DNA-binding protein
MISEYLEYSPEKNLSPGNQIRIEGSLQTNKTSINDTSIDTTYIVINSLSVENNQSLTKKVSNLNKDIKPKTKGVYTKNQPYSTNKPYHDNFPKEYDTRNKITCVCGQTFLDTLEYCPSCGRSTLEIIRKK